MLLGPLHHWPAGPTYLAHLQALPYSAAALPPGWLGPNAPANLGKGDVSPWPPTMSLGAHYGHSNCRQRWGGDWAGVKG